MLSWQTLKWIRDALSSNITHTTVDVNVNGSTFVEASRDVNLYFNDRCREGMKILSNNIVPAFHDAAERGDPPKCHPNTRMKICDEIMQWIRAPPAFQKFVLWLYGPAGAGKSAISQTIAEICASEGLLAASFFFARTVNGRNTSSHFIATIAYQLCISIPELRDYISASVESDPAIFQCTVAKQMDVLVLKPIKDALANKKLHSTNLRLAIVDGLDECDKESEQEEILNILASSHEILQKIHLVFLVASRPEYVIKRCFNHGYLASIMHGAPLDNSYRPDDDIEVFLEHRFSNIRRIHPLGSKLPQPWPTDAQVYHLVQKASGQFIYAATVTKYVGSRHHNPSKRLDDIFNLSSNSRRDGDTPFSQLDDLYRHILSSVHDLPKVMDILTLLILTQWSDTEVPIVEFLHDFDDGEVALVLQDMHALIQFMNLEGIAQYTPTTVLRLHHASFSDFLLDKSRSGQYFLDIKKGYTKLAILWLKMMRDFAFSTKEHSLWARWLMSEGKLSNLIFYCTNGTHNEQLSLALEQFDLPKYMRRKHKNVMLGYDISRTYDSEVMTWGTFLDGIANDEISNELEAKFKLQIFEFAVDKLDKYPEPLRSCMGAAICVSSQWALRDLFLGVLLSFKISPPAYMRIIDYDLELFGFTFVFSTDALGDGILTLLSEMLQDPKQAGNYIVDGGMFCQLAFRLVKHILQRITVEDLTRRLSWVQSLAHCGGAHWRPESYDFLSDILPKSSNSAKLASSLQTMLIHSGRLEKRYTTIKLLNACIEYMKRCHNDHSVPFTSQFPSLFGSTVAEDNASLEEFMRVWKLTVDENEDLVKSLLEQKADDDRYTNDTGIEEYIWDPEITIKETCPPPRYLTLALAASSSPD